MGFCRAQCAGWPKAFSRLGTVLSGLGAIALGLLVSFPVPESRAAMPERKDALSLEGWEALWTRVLERRVDAAGRIDFPGLAKDHAELDRVVAFIAEVDPVSSPSRFPTPNSRLAYYVNAYNALAMYGVVDAGIPERFGWFGRLRFFFFRTFTIGGRPLSLYSLENDIIRPLGDPRIHFALNCMVVSCPRLPRAAFTATDLDRELDAAAREFVNSDRTVRVDRGKREVQLSAIFDFYTKDFLAPASGLIAYINRYRAEPIPPDDGVAFMAYDWTINDRTRLGGPQGR